MARINLLPWREKLKKEQEKLFYITLGASAVTTLVIGVFIHIVISDMIGSQIDRNQYLTQNIAQLDTEIANIKTLEIEKTRLLNRMNVIQKLQRSRPEIVHLFEEIVNTLPDGMRLLSIEQNGNSLDIKGVADSNSRISSLMRNMDRSKWLMDPELIIIDSNKAEFPNASWFSLKVKRTHP